MHYYIKLTEVFFYLPRWALQTPQMKGHDKSIFVEVVKISTSVNQIKKRKNLWTKPSNPTHGATEPIHRLPPPSLAGSGAIAIIIRSATAILL